MYTYAQHAHTHTFINTRAHTHTFIRIRTLRRIFIFMLIRIPCLFLSSFISFPFSLSLFIIENFFLIYSIFLFTYFPNSFIYANKSSISFSGRYLASAEGKTKQEAINECCITVLTELVREVQARTVLTSSTYSIYNNSFIVHFLFQFHFFVFIFVSPRFNFAAFISSFLFV